MSRLRWALLWAGVLLLIGSGCLLFAPRRLSFRESDTVRLEFYWITKDPKLVLTDPADLRAFDASIREGEWRRWTYRNGTIRVKRITADGVSEDCFLGFPYGTIGRSRRGHRFVPADNSHTRRLIQEYRKVRMGG